MTSHLLKASRYEPYAALSPSNFTSEINGKSILITGGGSGIGSYVAHGFAEAGASSITIVGRTEARLQSTAKELSSKFPDLKVSYKAVNTNEQESIKKLFDGLDEGEGFDILVNNAGYLPASANFVDGEIEDWWMAFTTNVLGTAMLTQRFLRHRRELKKKGSNEGAGAPGIVVTINSMVAYELVAPQFSAYASSKLAAARLMEILTADVPETEARFFSVHPGAVKTDMYYKSGMDGLFTNTDGKLTAQFVVWLATEQAAFLNGRFVWVNWDIGELMELKDRILEKGLLRTAIKEGEF
jgi:NAD(P)-dependent dehydrogenase (short-subunit alcohol dehydrogenase family)